MRHCDNIVRKAWAGKRVAKDRFAIRRVANPILAAYEAVTEESSATQKGQSEAT